MAKSWRWRVSTWKSTWTSTSISMPVSIPVSQLVKWRVYTLCSWQTASTRHRRTCTHEPREAGSFKHPSAKTPSGLRAFLFHRHSRPTLGGLVDRTEASFLGPPDGCGVRMCRAYKVIETFPTMHLITYRYPLMLRKAKALLLMRGG